MPYINKINVGGVLYDVQDLEASTAVPQIKQMISNVESSPATAAHAAGSYLIYNNTLYRASADIAVGDALTVGTNIAAVSGGLAGDVADLKSAVDDLPISEIYENVTINWVRTDAFITKTGVEATASWRYQFFLDVTPGERFLLTGTNEYDKAIYATLDANGTPVRYPSTGNTGTVSDIEIVIGENETKLVLQAKADDTSIYNLKRYAGMGLDDDSVKYSCLDNSVTSLFVGQEATPKNLFNPNDLDIVPGKTLGINNAFTDAPRFNVSGFIPVENGKTYVCPAYPNYFGASVAARIYGYDGEKTYSTFFTGTIDSQTKLLTFTVSDTTVKYIRFNYANGSNSSDIKTVYQVVSNIMCTESPYPTTRFVPYGDYICLRDDVSVNSNSMSTFNPIYGKIAVFDGDSICHGTSALDGLNGWAGRIGTANDMMWQNRGISGGTITEITGYYCIGADIENIHAMYPTLDYLILEGGTNDADILKMDRIGTVSDNDYSGSYDTTTFSGAFETLIFKALSYYSSAKIGYIVAQKMGKTNNANYANRSNFLHRAIEICEKWGIPYINLWDNSPLNPNLTSMYDASLDAQGNIDAGKLYVDGQHLTPTGYSVVTPKIEQWMRGL